MKSRFKVLCMAASTIFLTAFAYQHAVANGNSVDSAAMISAHNEWRAKVGVPALTWSDNLAAESQKWVDHLAATTCTLGHSGVSHGENIYYASPVSKSDGTSSI